MRYPSRPGSQRARRPGNVVCVASCLLLSAFFTCSAAYNPRAGTITLEFAHPITGGRMRPALEEAIRTFERMHPHIRIREIAQNDQVYQEMGLVTRFVSGKPPDIYYQWGGYLVQKYARLGLAYDLTDEMRRLVPSSSERVTRWRDSIIPKCWPSCAWRGRVFMAPDSLSLSTLLWFNRKTFADIRVREPIDWNDFLSLCDRIRSTGRIPIVFGNRDLWPAGNFAAHLVSRVAGERAYHEVLSLKSSTRLDHPDFVRAFSMLETLARRGYFNRGINGSSSDEALNLFLNGKGALHPIGNWMVTQATTQQAKTLECFNMPKIAAGKGDQKSIIGLATGFMVYSHTRHPQEALAFLRFLTSLEVQRRWVETAGHMSAVVGAHDPQNSSPPVQKMRRFLDEAHEMVIAPDVGFDLEVSDAFYDAVSLVVGGRMTAREALHLADRQVEYVRSRNRATGNG